MKLEKVNRILWLVAAAAATFVTGCAGSKDEPAPPVIVSDMPINVGGSSTKTTLDGASDPTPDPFAGYTPLESHYPDFSVVAWKYVDSEKRFVIRRNDGSGYQTAFFPAEQAEYDSRWRYDFDLKGVTQYLRYWDKDASEYMFSAYAPFSMSGALTDAQVDAADLYSVGFDADGRVSIAGVAANSPSTTDWLVASYRRTVSPLADYDLLADDAHQPLAPTALTSDVTLVFHHILSSIEFRAFTDDGIPVTITGIYISLVPVSEEDPNNAFADSGNYLTPSWAPTHMTSTIANVKECEVVVDGNSRETSVLLPGTYLSEIPQNMVGKRVRVVIKTASRTYAGVFPLDSGWNPETHYIYYLRLSGSSVILVEVDIEKYHWREGNDIVIEPDVDNW